MTTVKKTHWCRNILIVMVICGIIGLIISVILFNQDSGSPYASATLQFSFDGAGEGKAPNGYPYVVSGIYSEEVLTSALEVSGLQDKYTTEDISDNLMITAIYPENIIKKMTEYNSLLNADAEQQAAMVDFHPTLYNVALYNEFDLTISQDMLKTLLVNTLEAYRDYFIKTSTFSLQKTDPITDLEEYDYTQQIQAISEAISQQYRFAQEMANLAPDFLKERKGFDDIVISYGNLKSDIDRLDANIKLNSLSKDRERLLKQYEMELRSLNRSLESAQEEHKCVEEMVASYEKDGIVYVSTSDSFQKVSSNASDTYDKLVAKRKELTDDISSINADITKYQALLDDMIRNTERTTETAATDGETIDTSEELTEAELKQLGKTTEKQIETLSAKKEKVTSDFKAMLNDYAHREINESTFLVSNPKYTAPSLLSGAFITKAIKTTGPICVAALIICIILLIRDRRKEEKAEKV